MRKIKSLPINLRPRERLMKYGADILNLEELLAVILITGNKLLPLSQISTKISNIIKKNNNPKDELLKLKIGQSKTAQILATLEIGKRLFSQNITTIKSDKQVFGLSYEIINKEKESVLCFYLNGRGELLQKELIAIGSLNKANLLPRDIFTLIKNLPIVSIILVHNHPSGNLDPSKEDLIFTRRIKLAGDLIGIKLLNHYIISQNGWNKIIF
ncbi:MAG: DNA repair protein RadC [Candidatus Shapirobacteria bacterium]